MPELGHDELRLVELLRDKGVNREEAVVAIILLTRGYTRPLSLLASQLSQFAGLENSDRVQQILQSMVAKGWVSVKISYNTELYSPALSLTEQISIIVEEDVAPIVLRVRPTFSRMRHLGPLSGGSNYISYLSLLEGAKSSLLLCMLATDSAEDVCAILERRSTAGVRVRLLLASPTVVGRLRGENCINGASRNLKNGNEECLVFQI